MEYPANSQAFLFKLYELANFDLIPTDWAEDYIDEQVGEADQSEQNYDSQTQARLSKTMIKEGIAESNVVENNILNYIVYGGCAATLIMLVLLRVFCFKFRWVKNCLDKIWRAIIWNMVLRVLIETCMENSVVNMIRMHSINTKTWFESVTTSLAFAWLIVLGLFGILVPLFLYKKRNSLNTKEFTKKYGSLTENLKTKSYMARFFYTFYVLRRMIVALVLVFLVPYPWSQAQLICFTTSLQLIYIGHF